MSRSSLAQLAALPLPVLRHIDAVCQQFEAACLANPGPCAVRIEAFLAGVGEPERTVLLHELLVLSVQLQHRLGHAVDEAEYLERFPLHHQVVREAVTEAVSLTVPDLPGRDGLPGTLPGGEFSSAYELLEIVGRGGMGIVYRARSRRDNRIVAVKLLRSDRLEELAPEQRAAWHRRFATEIRTVACLDHPQIVPVYAVGELQAQPCFVMPYLEGQTLAEVLRASPAAPAAAADYVEQAARAVHYAHCRGVLHRDLKPGNLMRTAEGQIVVMDFGLARWVEGHHPLTRSHDWLGTPTYMSPEQTTDPTKVTAASDVYSLGATLYELLTGRPPFTGRTPLDILEQIRSTEPVPPSARRAEVPASLDVICLKCLRKAPRQRYASAEALADDLRRFQAGLPIRARPPAITERLARWLQPRRAAVAAYGINALVAVLLVITAVWMVGLDSPDPQPGGAETAPTEAATFSVQRQQYEVQIRVAGQLIRIGRVHQARELLAHYVDPAAAADIRDFAWHYLWQRCAGERAVLAGHTRDVYHVSFSPDGALLASTGQDGLVKLWNPATGKEVATLQAHARPVGRALFSPVGDLLATAGDTEEIRLWEVPSLARRRTLADPSNQGMCLAFARDGSLLASGGTSRTIKVWDPRRGEMRATLLGHTGPIESLAFTSDSQQLISAAKDATVRVWDLASGQARHVLRPCEDETIHSVSISPDDALLAVGCADATIRILDLRTGQLRQLLRQHTDSIQSVTFSPDGCYLASAGNDRVVRLWDLATGQVCNSFANHQARVWCADFAPDGSTLATAGRDGTVRLWHTPGATEPVRINWHQGRVMALALTPDGNTLALGRDLLAGVELVHLPTRTVQAQLLDERCGSVQSLAFAGDGKRLATASTHCRVGIWDLADRTFRLYAGPYPARPMTVAFSVADQQLVALARERQIHFWDLQSGKVVDRLAQSPSPVALVALSPDGRMLATAHADGSATVWNRATLQPLYELRGHELELLGLAFSPDGRLLATWSEDRTARIWDMAAGRVRHVLRGHTSRINSGAFSADGKLLATGGQDRTVRLWSTFTGSELLSLERHTREVRALVWTADGQTLVSGAGTSGELPGELVIWSARRDDAR